MHPSDICNALYVYAREHNGCNVEMELNGIPTLLIQRHEDANYVLCQRASNFRKNMSWFRQTLGRSRFSEDGDAWELRRKLSHHYLTHFDRDKAMRLASRYATEAAQRMISASAAGATILDDAILRQMTASVLVENFFDIPLYESGIDLGHIAELLEYGAAYSFVPTGYAGSAPRDLLRRLPSLRRSVLDDLRAFRDGGLCSSPLLDDMIAADRNPHVDVVLEQELLSFLAAGSETSAATAGWAIYLLAAHPEIQQELRGQAMALASRLEEYGWSALAEFTGLSALLSEALRLYPPTPIIARRTVDHDRIDGRDIAPNQGVLISFVGIQHDRRYREDPWALDMSDDASRGNTAGLRSAFSLGPRICGGKQFARVELMAILFTLLQNAQFELSSYEPPRFHWKTQLLRQGGQPVIASRLGSAAPGRRMPHEMRRDGDAG